jgi:hypothetical protein
MFLKSNSPCPDPECPYWVLHCPYCGTTDIFLDAHEVHMDCPACRKGEVLPAAEFIQMRHRQVQDLTGRTIADWKARARQLAAPMRWRWRTAMGYLDPVASAAISRCDDLMLDGLTYVDAMAQTKEDLILVANS